MWKELGSSAGNKNGVLINYLIPFLITIVSES